MPGRTVTGGMLPPGFRIGRFVLRDGYEGPHKLWIETPGGEGGDFSVEKLEQLIAAFYTENF